VNVKSGVGIQSEGVIDQVCNKLPNYSARLGLHWTRIGVSTDFVLLRFGFLFIHCLVYHLCILLLGVYIDHSEWNSETGSGICGTIINGI